MGEFDKIMTREWSLYQYGRWGAAAPFSIPPLQTFPLHIILMQYIPYLLE